MSKKKPKLLHYRAAAAIVGLVVAVSGIMVIIGWKFSIEQLKNFGLGSVNMKPFTGLCFAITGLSLSLLYLKNKLTILLSRVFASLIIIAGLLSILEFIIHINFGIEDIIFRSYTSPHPFPGMLSFNTSFCILLAGVFLLFLSTRPNKFSYPAALIVVIIFSIGFIGFAGSFVGFSDYSEHTGFHNMSVLTSILLMLVSTGSLMFYLAYCALRISIEQKFYSTSVFILTIIVFITILTRMEFQSLREANYSVEKNRIIKTRLNQTVSQVLEIESAVRGFLLSGNDDYLQFVEEAKANEAMTFSELQRLLSDDPAQKIRLDTLNALVEKRIDHAGLILATTKRYGIDAGMVIFRTNKGKKLTSDIRDLADEMMALENTKIKESNNAAEERSSKVLSFIFINLAIEVALILVFFLFLGKNIRKRKEAVEEIILLNQKLDEMVRQRTAELAESEARYRDIVESSLVGVFSRSLQGIMMYANDAFAKILEFDNVRELVGSTSHNFYVNLDARRAFIDKLQMYGFVKNFESDLVTSKGNLKTVEVTAKLRDKIITGMMYDITDRKKTELALEESEAKLRLIMENAADAICLVNLKGEFLYVNPAASKMFGYTTDEIKNKTVADVTSPNLKDEIEPKIFRLLNEGKLFMEWTVLKKDNSIITVEINAVVLPDGLIYGSLRDITQRKKEYEELVRNRNHLEELMKKGQKRKI
jgi:PAS domain S-box-containing protein